MKNISPREDSHQTDNPTSLETLANSLRIPINISDNDTTEEQFKLLPRFRLTPLAGDKYGVFELELMAEADKRHIPYDKDNPDFCDLEDKIFEFELTAEADKRHIPYDKDNPDFCDLEDKIFEFELTAKADKWHIPYDKDNPDFCDLEDDTCEYEALIKRTIGLDIDWDFDVYDPIGLEQAIEESEDRECAHEKALWSDYYLSRGV